MYENFLRSSPYLSKLAQLHADFYKSDPLARINESIAQIHADIENANLERCPHLLRMAKGRIALLLGLGEMSEQIPVMEATRYLSEFADLAISKTLRLLIDAEIAQGRLPETISGPDCGIFILAMGKLGAFELNYSSDIDLIILYEEDRFDLDTRQHIRKSFVRIIQKLVKILSEPNADGYVFRVDLRLRPDPSVTPIVMGADQAYAYYEALGRTWERAAMIKARVCAGDFAAGGRFLDALTPFIWRRFLDFAAIEDAHDMRLRIRHHKDISTSFDAPSFHLKLGPGGIREIEFFTQTRQLIFGGRNESLRIRDTLGALGALERAQIITPELATFLSQTYTYLRHLEHATQMIHDQQTHIIPQNDPDLAHFFGLLGISKTPSFMTSFSAIVRKTDQEISKLYAGHPPQKEIDVDLDPEHESMIEGWLMLPATRSIRARRIFERTKGRLLESLLGAPDPHKALLNFDIFLRGLPAGVQVFSLLESNPHLLDMLVELCSIAPYEAKLLGKRAQIFEAVLDPEFYQPITVDTAYRQALCNQLGFEILVPGDYEDALNAARRFTREAQFRTSIHLLRDLIKPLDAACAYSVIMDVALDFLFETAYRETVRRFGRIPDSRVCVLAMGRLGSREATRASDLDLLVVYDAPPDAVSDTKALSSNAYFARFTKILISALSTQTSEGALFEVDMRLRPSGHQGPVAVSLKSFQDYQMNEAWTWEHMALLRARTVTGDATLGTRIETTITDILQRPRDSKKIQEDARQMIEKIRTNITGKETPLAIKHGKGRLMELELLLQAKTLIDRRAGYAMSGTQMMMGLDIPLKDKKILKTAFSFYQKAHQIARVSFQAEPKSPLSSSWIALLREPSIKTQTDYEAHLRMLSHNVNSVLEKIL